MTRRGGLVVFVSVTSQASSKREDIANCDEETLLKISSSESRSFKKYKLVRRGR